MQHGTQIMEAMKIASTPTQTPTETTVKKKADKKSGKRIGYNYIVLKSLKESQKNDVVKCLYIKSLIKFGICVIKEGTYGDSKDREGRDIKDKLMWQKQLHEQLQDKIRIPRLLGSFEENGNYYLVIERIRGKSLYEICRKRHKESREGLITGNKIGMMFLGYMIQFIKLLDTLHREQIVHRDVSSNNFIITPAGRVTLIDFELSYSLDVNFPSPPFQLGTRGFMSPQQETEQPPSIKDDIFSVGAILLQMWTGISPSKLTKASTDALLRKAYFFIPDQLFAEIVFQCLHADPDKRPSLEQVYQVIETYKSDLLKKKNRLRSKPIFYQQEEILDTVQQAMGTFASPLLTDPEKGWFSENTNIPSLPDRNKINKEWYASFSKGAAGVLYMLSMAKRSGINVSVTSIPIQRAMEIIEARYINRSNTIYPSLHFGSSGVAACISLSLQEKLIEAEPRYIDWINKLIAVENNTFDFINGIAGQGMAHWVCQPYLDEKQMHIRLATYVNMLLEKQEKNGSWSNETNKKHPTKGFARGVAGITYFLMEYAFQYQEREPMLAAKRGIDWLAQTAVHRKDSIQWLSSTKKEIPPRWNEGAPGIALSFMKAYDLFGEPAYKKYAISALNNNPVEIISDNLDQECGLCGLGEIYLEANRVFGEGIWAERANWIVQAVMNMKKENKKHGPYWLVGNEGQPISDFMKGNSGVLHFLLRYAYPEKLSFPMSLK